MALQKSKKPRAASRSAEHHSVRLAGYNMLEVPEPSADVIAERQELESDTATWLRQLWPGIFRQPFGAVHHQIIEAAEHVINQGGRGVIAAPRGTGKSYVVDGISFKTVLQERARFPVVIPWDARSLKKAIDFWKKSLCFNPEVERLYPEWCFPFVASRGQPQRCLAYTDQDGNPIGARLMAGEGMIVLPFSRGVIGGATLNGNPLGLHFTTDSGEGLRPDLIFVDDPQDRDTALSEAQIRQTIDLIDQDIAGMAGPDVAMPILMTCTVKAAGDVAEHYLTHGEWTALRVPRVTSWPTGWDEPGGETRRLWDEWHEVGKEGEHDKDRGAARIAYYEAHKAAMTAGMSVSWDSRYISKPSKGKLPQPDALYSAMYDYYTFGAEAFMSEYQNQPIRHGSSVYDLTAEVVCSRVSHRAQYDVPDWARVVVVGTDINDYGLHSVCTAFGNDHSAAVLWYRRHDRNGYPIVERNTPEAEKHQRIYEALVQHGREISMLPLRHMGNQARPTLWVIDRPYPAGVVHRYAAETGRHVGVQILPAWGADFTKYRPFGKGLVGRPREQCHLWDYPGGRALVWNVDYWREVAQRSWLGSVGAPGACSLFHGASHRDFAEHVCRYKLIEKVEGKTGTFWKWATAPGWHDYGAAFYMCYAGAAWAGIGTGGNVPPAARRVRPQRKCKVEIEA